MYKKLVLDLEVNKKKLPARVLVIEEGVKPGRSTLPIGRGFRSLHWVWYTVGTPFLRVQSKPILKCPCKKNMVPHLGAKKKYAGRRIV